MTRYGLLVLALATLLHAPALAETAEEKGYRIAKTASMRGQGYGSYESVGEMTLKDRQGVASVRRFRTQALEVKGGDRFIIVFELPRDIAAESTLA